MYSFLNLSNLVIPVKIFTSSAEPSVILSVPPSPMCQDFNLWWMSVYLWVRWKINALVLIYRNVGPNIIALALWCLSFCFFLLAWWVGQGSWERWWWRRLCERGRRCIWKERSSGRGAILQVNIPWDFYFFPTTLSPINFFCLFVFSACRQKEKEQMEALRKHHTEEIEHHKKEIERLQKEIDRHKGKIRKLKHDDWTLLFLFRSPDVSKG